MLIYKVMTAAEHQSFSTTGVFEGSPDDRRDGFIHLSAGQQLAGTLAKHFAGQGPLHLLACEADALGDALKWEISRGGKAFPHLYRPLTAGDVLWDRPLPPDAEGAHPLPADLGL
ncbi:MAG: DUF952 domain-containing protein [Pseudomonadota bacterium]